jgi:hypothetical protein
LESRTTTNRTSWYYIWEGTNIKLESLRPLDYIV